jgi:hypothetical protein
MTTYGARDWTERSTVAAVFVDKDQAKAAVAELKERGFDEDKIGFAVRDAEEGTLKEESGNHAGSGAATGAVTGGILGGVVGLLIGIGAIAIPGIGPVIAGGALASALGTAGATAAVGAGAGLVAGGLVGALIGMGIPKHEAEYFESGFREGKAIVTVTAPGRADVAAAILEANGGDTGRHMYQTAA